jgi:hypothetical protein
MVPFSNHPYLISNTNFSIHSKPPYMCYSSAQTCCRIYFFTSKALTKQHKLSCGFFVAPASCHALQPVHAQKIPLRAGTQPLREHQCSFLRLSQHAQCVLRLRALPCVRSQPSVLQHVRWMHPSAELQAQLLALHF